MENNAILNRNVYSWCIEWTNEKKNNISIYFSQIKIFHVLNYMDNIDATFQRINIRFIELIKQYSHISDPKFSKDVQYIESNELIKQ